MNDMDQDPLTIDDYTAPAQPTVSDASPKPGRKTARATIVGALVVWRDRRRGDLGAAFGGGGLTEPNDDNLVARANAGIWSDKYGPG